MSGPRLQITGGMRRFLDYPKFRGGPRVLVLETGYFFDAGWKRAAAALGGEARGVKSAMVGDLTRDDVAALFTALAEFQPDFILTSNYAGMDTEGLFARFFEDARIPYVSWFTDTPRMILFGRKMHISPWSVAATWERAYIPHFKSLGFDHIHHMPLATDPALFDGDPATAHARPLAFVGNSMIEHTGEAIDRFRDKPAVLQAVIAAFDAGHVSRDTYAQGLPGMLPEALLATLDATDLRNLELLINYEATQRQRVDLARALAPLGLEVRGDPHWLQVHDKVGGNVGYFNDLAPFYRGTAVNVNSTSLQMRSAVNQRVFDCPAAGGFLITDAQGDLFEHFDPDGGEVAAYRSLDELRDLAAYYLAHPEEARAVAARARRRVLAEHTLAHRLRDLTAFLRGIFA